MKYLLSAICVLSSLVVMSQTTVPDSLYIVTYVTGPGWDKAKQPNDQAAFKEHSAHLSQLRKEGTIKMGARFAEKGILIFSAGSLAKAREIVESDQAIKSQLFLADVQKLNVFYEGCVERPK